MNQNAFLLQKKKLQNCNQIFYRISYRNTTCKEEKSIQHINACLASRTVATRVKYVL